MAYGSYASIEIQNGKVAGDHTGFPIPVQGTFDGTGGEADLRVTGSGGNIQNVDATATITGTADAPADFVFSPNTDGSSPYSFEIITYDSTTGELTAYVKIPTMDASDDLTFYMVYGDSDVTTSQENISGTWASYEAVYHLNNQLKDSSGNLSDLSTVNSPTGSATGGKIKGYYEFTGGGSDGLYVNEAAITANPFTIECLYYATVAYDNHDSLMSIADKDVNDHHISLNVRGNLPNDRGAMYQGDFGGAGGAYAEDANIDHVHSTWYHQAGVMGATDTDKAVIINGTNEGNNAVDLGPVHAIDITAIGYRADSSPTYCGDTMRIEEARYSSDAKSDNWIETTDNSFDIATFLVFGLEANSDEVPTGVINVTGYAPTVGLETIHIRTADGSTLLGQVADGDGVILFSDGTEWFAFDLPAL